MIFLFNMFRDVRFKIWSHLNMNSWCINFLILSFSKIFLGFWIHFWRQIQKLKLLFYSRLSRLNHNFYRWYFHFNLLWHDFQFLLLKMFFPTNKSFLPHFESFLPPLLFEREHIYQYSHHTTWYVHDSYMTTIVKSFLPLSTMGGGVG